MNPVGLLTVSRVGKYRVYNQENIYLIKLIKEAQTLELHCAQIWLL